tara:strand:+ start:571 stop:1173 length:603 start_codon:yes stop_codon:yes gene_type:complete
MNPHPQNRNEPISLHDHAQENLRFIRAAMESATSFTGVSGLGYVFAGLTAIPAAWLAKSQSEANAWLAIWMIELILGASIAFGFTIRKAIGQGDSLLSTSGRKLLLAFLPAMIAGGLITLSFCLSGFVQLLPGVWLSLYGAAVMTAGAWSVRVIPTMGAFFLLTGAVAMLAPVSGDVMLALGFGGLHIVFGIVIWSKYGG